MTNQKLKLRVREQTKTHPTLSEIKVYLQIGKQYIQKQIDHYFEYQSLLLQQLQSNIDTVIQKSELGELNSSNQSHAKLEKAKEIRMYLEKIKQKLNFQSINKGKICQKICPQIEQIITNSFKVPGLQNEVMKAKRQNLKNTAVKFLKQHEKFCRKNIDENKTIIRLDQFLEKHYQQFKGVSSIPKTELQSTVQHFSMGEIKDNINKNRIKLEQKIRQDYEPFINQLSQLMASEVRPEMNIQQQSQQRESQIQEIFFPYSSNGLTTTIESENMSQQNEGFKSQQMHNE